MIVFLNSIVATVVGISLRPMLYRQPIDPGRQRRAALDRPEHRRNINHKTPNDLKKITLFMLTEYGILKVLNRLHKDVVVLRNVLFII